jgi:hypothetical protein
MHLLQCNYDLTDLNANFEISLNWGLVAPNIDFTYVLTSKEISTTPESGV